MKIYFIYDFQIFNPCEFNIYVINEDEKVFIGKLQTEITINNKYKDYSLCVESNGGPKFFSSYIINENHYRLSLFSKKFNEYFYLI